MVVAVNTVSILYGHGISRRNSYEEAHHRCAGRASGIIGLFT